MCFQNESGQPQSEAGYLLQLKNSPDNGSSWSKLIAFTAAHKGVEAARARAEQALQTVSYRFVHKLTILSTNFIDSLVIVLQQPEQLSWIILLFEQTMHTKLPLFHQVLILSTFKLKALFLITL